MSGLELNHAGGCCRVEVAAGLLDDRSAWANLVPAGALIVTDRTVAGLYLDRLCRTLADHQPRTLVLPAGEQAKTAAHWMEILERLAADGAQRDVTVIALGGGVIGDLAGFAAASWMRGVRLIQVPTTLLAQVDAAIGGKTGFNLAAGKNLVGAFHQPVAVMADVATLKTLEDRDYRAGLAEVVKYGAIRDAGFLAWLEENASSLLERNAEALAQAVRRSVTHKIEIVEADERETGQRALLNFGHTFGHAIEAATGYRRYRHGEAVAIGMHLAARLSSRLGMIDATDAARLTNLLEALGLPVDPPDDVDPTRLIELMRLDKKNLAGRFRLILLEA
ncbi:MAG: 3-dehydroquinate synthase, partial [Wenzhouxiangellaceae bacterium]